MHWFAYTLKSQPTIWHVCQILFENIGQLRAHMVPYEVDQVVQVSKCHKFKYLFAYTTNILPNKFKVADELYDDVESLKEAVQTDHVLIERIIVLTVGEV